MRLTATAKACRAAAAGPRRPPAPRDKDQGQGSGRRPQAPTTARDKDPGAPRIRASRRSTMHCRRHPRRPPRLVTRIRGTATGAAAGGSRRRRRLAFPEPGREGLVGAWGGRCAARFSCEVSRIGASVDTARRCTNGSLRARSYDTAARYAVPPVHLKRNDQRRPGQGRRRHVRSRARPGPAHGAGVGAGAAAGAASRFDSSLNSTRRFFARAAASFAPLSSYGASTGLSAP